jgi:hypothetical protein
MIDVEKLLREGKTEEDILKLLSGEVETANLKLEKEREAAKIEALKQEQLKDAKAQAEAALQAVYDLADGNIGVVILNGKVQVRVPAGSSRGNRAIANVLENSAYKAKSAKDYNSILDDILNIWGK